MILDLKYRIIVLFKKGVEKMSLQIIPAFFLVLFSCLMWRRKWQPTPVFLPTESCGQRSLVGCCPYSRIEPDTTEVT